jgi:hypothetical protein
MEKNIASHDLSDMMIYEGMHAQSQRFQFKQHFLPLQRFAEKCLKAYERAGKASRKKSHNEGTDFLDNTVAAVYSIGIASVVISFFWLTLLLSPTS